MMKIEAYIIIGDIARCTHGNTLNCSSKFCIQLIIANLNVHIMCNDDISHLREFYSSELCAMNSPNHTGANVTLVSY